MNRIVFAHAQVFHYLYNTFIILISKRVYYSVKLPKYFAMATGSISTDSDPPESVSGVGNDSPKFCSPKGAKSPVWAHFAFLLDRQGKRANAKQIHCFHCREVGAHEKAIVAYCNNTTNLQQHLCTWHRLPLRKRREGLSLSILGSV